MSAPDFPPERTRFPVMLFLLCGICRTADRRHRGSVSCRRALCLHRHPTLENYETIFESTSYISFLWSLGLAALTVVLLALDLLSGRLRAGARLRQMGDMLAPCSSPFRCSCRRTSGSMAGCCSSSRMACMLGTLEVLCLAWQAREHPLHAPCHCSRHGLCLPAIHAVSHDTRHQHGAAGNARCGNRSRRFALAGVPGGGIAVVDARHHHRLLLTFVLASRCHRRGQGAGRATDHPHHP
jgi:hypothetical protein